MDLSALDLSIFLGATLLGAITSGLAGFAFGLVVIGAWLHFLPPLTVAMLISAFGIVIQSMGIWRLRHALSWRALWPFIISGAIGAPIGVAILGIADPLMVRRGIGILLILYSTYALMRPVFAPFAGRRTMMDMIAGFANGVLGGMTGLTGVVITIWCSLRGWQRDAQRAVFQPVIMAMFVMNLIWIGASREVPRQALWLFVLGLPVLLGGVWFGLRLYGRLDEAGFRRIVLLLLLGSGFLLVAV